MENTTVDAYQDAILNAGLSERQIKVLEYLYSLPNSAATAKELAAAINMDAPNPIIASGAIGKIGKKLSAYLEIDPGTYLDGRVERVAYFRLIGIYYSLTGWHMWNNLQRALENLKLVQLKDEKDELEPLPTEITNTEGSSYKEGNLVSVLVNKYERNRKARAECIAYYGPLCAVCDFDFGITYGDFAKDFIHVHHKKPISEVGEEYTVNPIEDLIPVCPNCHSALHLGKEVLSIEELKARMKR